VKFPDVNLLVAMSMPAHPQHAQADAWRKANTSFATCPLTELGLVRVLMQTGAAEEDAHAQLQTIVQKHRKKLVPCDLSATVIAGQASGHRATTDAYLLALARAHKLTLCTFDTGIKGAETLKS
jgi:toxin-antitoxin system PIN domain toxin